MSHREAEPRAAAAAMAVDADGHADADRTIQSSAHQQISSGDPNPTPPEDEMAGNRSQDRDPADAQRGPGAELPRARRKLSHEDLARFKREEEARGMLELELDERDGLKQTEADESAADPSPFGLPHVELDSPRRRSSLTSSLKALLVWPKNRSAAVVVPTSNAGPVTRQRIPATSWASLGSLVLLLDALYVLLSVPFRVGFLYDPWAEPSHARWSHSLVAFSLADVLGELVRWQFAYHTLRRRRRAPSWLSRRTSSISPALLAKSFAARPARGSLFSVREPSTKEKLETTQPFETLSAANEQHHREPPLVVLVVGVLPIEIAAAVVDVNWLHLVRCSKVFLAGYTLLASYAALLLASRRSRWVQWLSFSTLATPFYLFWLGLYLCHLSACGYMLIANIECGLHSQHCVKTPLPGSWVLKDNMDRATLWRQYVRTMYWASKTVTTLGQGDLVPATLWETNYCIVVQFISGLWATAFLASCTFYFSRRDRDIENGVSTRLEQALRFLRSRKVPPTLAIQIRNYYQHIQRTRNGIEEEQILTNLPGHYQFQCAFFIKYRLIAKVPFFAKQNKAFVRTVVNAMDSDFLSPGDTVVALYDIEELIIVARGEISVLNQQKEVVRELTPEEWFAEDAIFNDNRSQFELEAKSFCEIFRLSKLIFVTCMEKHFPKLKIAAVMAQYHRRQTIDQTRGAQPARPTIALVKPKSSKMTFLKRLSQRDGFDSVPWQHPNSLFRKTWRRWKAFLLLFLAVEVPYEIAFKWRRGFFGRDVTISQQLVYVVAFATEIFFYIDWFLRACRLFRRPPCEEMTPNRNSSDDRRSLQKSLQDSSGKPIKVRKRDDLITNPMEIFRLYTKSDDLLVDVLSIVPISVVWDLVNQSSYNVVLRETMRCARLLALLRLFSLKPVLKKIMVEIDFSPASQLLTNVIVFCIITANAMACYFYLLADDKEFVDALPIGFDPSVTPVPGPECLEQATLYGNCTWFIYDRSTFGIEARFIRSMHWSLVLLSTVGYGDILSFTNSECLIGFWWIYLGALICYFTSCAVGSVVSQVTILTASQDHRVEEITRALVRSEVPPSTRAMIRCHYEANWELNGSVQCEEGLMKRLPRSLRYQLSSSLYLQTLRKCYVFVGFGGQLQMIREIALCMTSTIILPGFPIVESGHLATEMYLVQSGEVEILLPLRLRGGSVLGKKIGFIPRRHRRCLGGDWLHRLSRKIFPESSFDGSFDGSPSSTPCVSRGYDRHRLKDTPIAVLKEGDCFGEEGLLPHESFALRVTARALTSTQVAVLRRGTFLSLSDRFPVQLGQMIALIMKRYEENQCLYDTVRGNLEHRDKVREYLGWCRSVYMERAALVNGIITPDRDFFRV